MNQRRVAIATATAILVASTPFQIARADRSHDLCACYQFVCRCVYEPLFHVWLRQQPQQIQELAASSTGPSHAERLLNKYSADMTAWLAYQSEQVRKLAASQDPDDAIRLLDKYSADMIAAKKAPSGNYFDKYDKPAAGAESIEAQLKRVADETRKSLPMMVSEDVQATSIAAVGKVLMNRYNFTSRKSAIPDLKSLKAKYYQNSVNAACTNPDTSRALRNGVSINYQYYDSANEFVMQYTLDAATCRKR